MQGLGVSLGGSFYYLVIQGFVRHPGFSIPFLNKEVQGLNCGEPAVGYW